MINTPAAEKISKIISKQGYITLDDFIAISNAAYYQQTPAIAKSGDFTTAPEISQLFGETIALAIYAKWQNTSNSTFNLVELGPGNGTLMSDILRTLKKLPKILESMEKCMLVEKSESLLAKQKQTLSQYKIEHYSHLNEIDKENCIIICNEFFDALPIKQFAIEENGTCKEIIIREKYQNLFFDKIESKRIFTNSKNGDMIEHSDSNLEYARLINEKTKEGFALIIDYGYWDAPKISTLQAIKNGQKANPLKVTGIGDITYHVDFKSLAHEFTGRTVNFSTQAEFLSMNGIQMLAGQIIKKHPHLKLKITADLNRLLAQNEMGMLFKVLEIC